MKRVVNEVFGKPGKELLEEIEKVRTELNQEKRRLEGVLSLSLMNLEQRKVFEGNICYHIGNLFDVQ